MDNPGSTERIICNTCVGITVGKTTKNECPVKSQRIEIQSEKIKNRKKNGRPREFGRQNGDAKIRCGRVKFVPCGDKDHLKIRPMKYASERKCVLNGLKIEKKVKPNEATGTESSRKSTEESQTT